jgi:protein SCO1/2
MRTPLIRTAAALVTGVLAVGVLAGCGSGEDKATPAVEVSGGTTDVGTALDEPMAKPDLVLTDAHGKKYDLVKQTAGKPTLLFFGYTHCPDVCPTTMADIALAKKKLPKADQDKLQVVFVTTDPQHDDPKRLRGWLDAQDPSFIGLTGDYATIEAAAKSVGVFVEKSKVSKSGVITANHGSQVLAYSPKDDKAHILYTAGVTSAQYAKELPKLVQGKQS